MDNNTYLNFIYRITNKNYLKEKVKITKFLKDKKINENNILRKPLNTTFYICEIEVDKDTFLLIEDIGINFLLSYTILIGEKTLLLQFISKNKKYICSKELFDKIKTHYTIESSTLKEIKPRELYNKKYKLQFKQPEIVEHLKEYVSAIKKLPFNCIHITHNNRIENFVPTIKTEHLELAQRMNIPLVSLLQNNFIKESTINIYDNEKIKEIIKPVFEYEQKVMWDISKDNKLKLYKDISREYAIEFDSEKVIEELFAAQIVNFDRDSVALQIKNLNSIILSSNHGKYALPVWKSSNEQRFISIKDVDTFKSMSGVEFKLDTQFYKDIYFQTLSGEQAIYKSRFLSEDLNTAIETLEENKKIEFSSIKELVIKLIHNSEMGVLEIYQRETINPNKLLEFEKKIEKIIDKIIKLSIMYNKKPKYKRPTEIFEQYYFSIANSIPNRLEEFNKYPNKTHLLIDALKISNRIINSLNMHKANEEELYFVCLSIINLIQTLKIYNSQKAEDLIKFFMEYFDDFKSQSKYSGVNPDIESLIDDIFFTNKISKNKKVSIYLKQNISTKIFNKINLLDSNPPHNSIIKPNIPKLKKMFKYSWEDAVKQISKLNTSNIKHNMKLKLRDKDVDLIQDYYTIFENYTDYKVILENDYFKVLIDK